VTDNTNLIVLTLASVCQSARLVQQLAGSGRCAEEAAQSTLATLSHSSPAQGIAHLAENPHQLTLGLQCLSGLLIQPTERPASKDIARYALGVLHLERRLNSDKHVQSAFYDRIKLLTRQRQFYSEDSIPLMQVIAAIYTDLISPLGPRIQIQGEKALLQSPYMQSKIRALLLCGLNSAIWWRSLGGNRLQLIFRRQKLIKHTQSILSALPADEYHG
jgi:high frequency lysogenization protein